jgi:hypothetical protein
MFLDCAIVKSSLLLGSGKWRMFLSAMSFSRKVAETVYWSAICVRRDFSLLLKEKKKKLFKQRLRQRSESIKPYTLPTTA